MIDSKKNLFSCNYCHDLFNLMKIKLNFIDKIQKINNVLMSKNHYKNIIPVLFKIL